MRNKKNAFSLIEILISVSIITILSIVATVASNNIKNNSYNSKVISDLGTIDSALISYSEENNSIPKPDWNNNNFTSTWVYAHDYNDAFWTYWKFSQDTLAKMYLDSTPLDPRTNQYYSYWITSESKQFEVSWVIYDKEVDTYSAKVLWNYSAENWLNNLIREYNWVNFVSDKSTNLPYNPYERTLTVTDSDWNEYREWETIVNNSTQNLELYFSDWSVSILSEWSKLTLSDLSFNNDANLTSKIRLFLQAWAIWTKATRLDEDSWFEVFTTDSVASVRWTIFSVSIINNKTNITLYEWELDIYTTNNEVPEKIEADWINYKSVEINWENITVKSSHIEMNENFSYTNNIIENTTVNNNDNYLSKIVTENSNKSCYLWWEEILNWSEVNAYKFDYVEVWWDCWDTEERICNDWKLSWNSQYAYKSCVEKEIEQCFPYDEDWYIWWEVTDLGAIKNVTKQNNIYINWVTVWSYTSSREIKCINNWRSYELINEIENNIQCNDTFIIDDENISCSCESWKNYNPESWKCEEPILYSWRWCGECYNNKTYKKGWYLYKEYCTEIVNASWKNVLCEEQVFDFNISAKKRSWSWYLKN